jgi:hypothetical protein
MARIQDVVDKTLPHPAPKDRNYDRWVYWTTLVADWLFNQVEEAIRIRIEAASGGVPEEADELMAQINEVVRAEDIMDNVKHEVVKFWTMRRRIIQVLRHSSWNSRTVLTHYGVTTSRFLISSHLLPPRGA